MEQLWSRGTTRKHFQTEKVDLFSSKKQLQKGPQTLSLLSSIVYTWKPRILPLAFERRRRNNTRKLLRKFGGFPPTRHHGTRDQ